MDIKTFFVNENKNWESIIKLTDNVVDSIYKKAKQLGLAEEGDLDNKNNVAKAQNVIYWTLKTKKPNILGANLLALYLSPEDQKNFISIITRIELVTVDIADTAGDYLQLRGFDDSRKIYELSQNLLTNKILVNPFLHKNNKELHLLGQLMVDVCLEARNEFNKIKNNEAIREYMQKNMRDYGWGLTVRHIQEKKERERRALEFYNKATTELGRTASKWIPKEIWYVAQSTSTDIGALLFELLRKKQDLSSKDAQEVYELYNEAIQVLHQWIDDMVDVEEDQKNNDWNLYQMVKDGKLRGYKDTLSFSLAISEALDKKYHHFKEYAAQSGLDYHSHATLLNTMIKMYYKWRRYQDESNKEILENFELLYKNTLRLLR